MTHGQTETHTSLLGNHYETDSMSDGSSLFGTGKRLFMDATIFCLQPWTPPSALPALVSYKVKALPLVAG